MMIVTRWRTHLIGLVTLVAALLVTLAPVQGAGIPNDLADEDPRIELHRQAAVEARQKWLALQPPPALLLQNISHEYQGWNNCGPTTLGMDLRFFGLNLWQKDTAPVLKPNPNDKNVRPDEMAVYAQSKGLKALVRVNGSYDRLKRLVMQGIPVILQIWYLPEDNGGFGHYRLLKGYDDGARVFKFSDAFLGPDIQDPYDTLKDQWRVYNNTYIVVYRPEQEETVKSIIGDEINDKTMNHNALQRAQADLQRMPNDAFAWFTAGTAQHATGDDASAAASFDKARSIGLPPRMLWYQFAPFESYLALKRYQDVINITTGLLTGTPELEESHFYKAEALEALGRKDEARAEYQLALRYNRNYARAAQALKALGPAVAAAPASATTQ